MCRGGLRGRCGPPWSREGTPESRRTSRPGTTAPDSHRPTPPCPGHSRQYQRKTSGRPQTAHQPSWVTCATTASIFLYYDISWVAHIVVLYFRLSVPRGQDLSADTTKRLTIFKAKIDAHSYLLTLWDPSESAFGLAPFVE